MSTIKFSVLGSLELKKQLQLMQLPPAKRRQLLGGIGREIKRQSVRNLRAGKGVNGTSWEPRKRGAGRKLLRHLNRQIAPNLLTDGSVEVSFRGAVAKQQHDGFTKVMTAAAMARERGVSATQEDPATTRQAKALLAEGFRIRQPGTKKWRKPSAKWIRENISQKKAGVVLRILRNEQPKKTWVTKVPARSFLGATEQQINQFVNKIFDNTVNSRR